MPQRVRQDRGFTLIEIMLVLVILGVVSAVAVIRAPAGTRHLEVEAARFAAALALMSEQAIVRGVPHAVDIGAAQYRLREFQRGEWTTKAFAGIAPVHKLPASIRLELMSDVAVPDRATRIVLLPSGEANADGFSVTDRASGDVVRYAAATTGQFERVP
tara:strand:- start:3272 stop:3748 length:477 start_codon:yes stop_codon:yes gene_type:complete